MRNEKIPLVSASREGGSSANVSHLRRLQWGRLDFPILTDWANFCRAYGARNIVLRQMKGSLTASFPAHCKTTTRKESRPFRRTLEPSERWRRMAFACAVLVVAFLFAGCGKARDAKDADTVNFLIESMPINLDPRIGTDAQSAASGRTDLRQPGGARRADERRAGPRDDVGNARPADVRVSSAARREIPRRAGAHVRRREVHF